MSLEAAGTLWEHPGAGLCFAGGEEMLQPLALVSFALAVPDEAAHLGTGKYFRGRVQTGQGSLQGQGLGCREKHMQCAGVSEGLRLTLHGAGRELKLLERRERWGLQSRDWHESFFRDFFKAGVFEAGVTARPFPVASPRALSPNTQSCFQMN